MKITNSLAGFTLAELLTVIIIIAVLTGIGIGYYKRSVEQANFSDGLAGANAVVEALNRTYLDEVLEGNTPPALHTFNTLDTTVGTACASGNCRKTKYFEVYIENTGSNEVVRAYREGKTGPKSGIYYIEVYPNYAAAAYRGQIACVGQTDDGQTFCESVGYVNCDGNGRCLK